MSILSGILDLLFPPRCVFCRNILKRGESDFCSRCGENLPTCEGRDAVLDGEFFSKCVSPLYYECSVRDSLLRYKFKSAKGYVSCYGKILAHCIDEHFLGKYDLITWVPISDKRLKKRGYDQSMILAMATALELDDVAVETVKKTRDNPAQSGLDEKEERWANVSGAYEVTDIELIDGKRILLIDDIVTTGATLSECARTLLMAGAEEVMCATIARGQKEFKNIKCADN